MRFALERARGIPVETDLRGYLRTVEEIREFDFRSATETDLAGRSGALRDLARREGDSALDALLPEAYALVTEAARRRLGIDPFDEQVVAGIVMHLGKLAQMRTGEGKTLAAVLPAYLNALSGRGVHVITANDYLARRDAEWMGPVYEALGLQVAFAIEGLGRDARRRAYAADVTYVTARQAGFDYLYDNLAYAPADLMQRGLELAIVDEADFILIDEARVPMVVAAPEDSTSVDPVAIDRAASRLERGEHFTVDRAGRLCTLTAAGERSIGRLLGCGGSHDERFFDTYAAVNVALHARHLLTKDVDYVVKNGRIELVDELTGRIADRRRWPYGIQTALEAAVGVPIQREGRVCARITVHDFVSLYRKRAAMTATAVPAAEELHDVYGIATVVIPPHRPDIAVHRPDLVFITMEKKLDAIVAEVSDAHAAGRPVLVGTRTVRESEELAGRMRGAGIECSVLNARNDEEEAGIIAGAGRMGAVTISTNMAGRGTDIRLGTDAASHDAVAGLGGLYVIGSTRQEASRVDDQLRGRSGRQGDPGLTRIFVSLEDDLIRRYGVEDFFPAPIRRSIAEHAGSGSSADGGSSIEDPRVAREILRAQRIIEHQHSQMRETLRKYSAVIELERRRLVSVREDALRDRLLPGEYLAAAQSAFDRLTKTAGEALAEEAAVRCLLLELDDFWSRHLELSEEIREGIHLQRLGRRQPLLVYIEEMSANFERGIIDAYRRAADALGTLEPDSEGRIEFARTGLAGPAATWTYLVNDNPFPDFNLGMIADSNIGTAAASALPMLLFWPFFLIARIARGRRTGRRQGTGGGTDRAKSDVRAGSNGSLSP